ncbi:MAG: Putative oxidoreductase [uncultured Rubrobacteraceae bacterium]|uniref:Oxidoreductase n=1 Tax=uncultured Rubrobacteraceae bacterium TaxID=349277 RepID=A0A6J4RC62_9ACTN|nr:MAG: Putative oxidoreductase [uncultured Rubrobacteraceae bacterium]
MPDTISPGFEKLLSEPAYCQISTLMPDGSPQITQVWVDTDGEHILINTAEGRQKERNVRRDPRVAVNVVDTADAWRIAMVRGRVVDITTEGADDLIDQLAKKYLDVDSYPNRQPDEVRVTLKIAPERVNAIGLD